MAANHEYIHRMTSHGAGWRWLLRIRCAEANDITTFTAYDIPEGIISLVSLEAGYANKPLGMPDATMLTIEVDHDLLTGTELEYLSSQLQDSYHSFGPGDIGLNMFILTCDYGNGALAEADFLVVSVTAQKPTLERESGINEMVSEIDTMDAFKLVNEMSEIGEQWSLGSFAPQIGTTLAGELYPFPRVYEWHQASLKRYVYAGNETDTMQMRRIDDGLQTLGLRLAQSVASAVRKKSIHLPTFETFMTGRTVHPIHDGWEFFQYDVTGDDLNVADPLATHDVWYVATTTKTGDVVTGLEMPNSIFNFGALYKNWWNCLQNLSEQWFAKTRVRWLNMSGSPVPVSESCAPWENYGNTPVGLTLDDISGANITRGHEVLKTATALTGKRNTAFETTILEDLSEFSHGTTLSIADDEWGVTQLSFDNLPTANGQLAGEFNDGDPSTRNSTSYRIWMSMLFMYNASINAWNRIHHHVRVSDGLVTSEGPATTASVGPGYTGSGLAAQMLSIQTSHGGLAQTICKAIYQAFGRVNQSQLTFSTFLDARFMPNNIGDVFSFTVPAEVNARHANIFDEPAVQTNMSLEFASEEMNVTMFLRGSRDPL